ncbi:MAG: ATP-binding cassette domain-containing protein [Thermoanaerobaculia bacterium]
MREVIQSSSMDCGPASLKALLDGFRIDVSYGRLREACQTDVDGSSIDELEKVANRLGLDAEQVMLPVDHLLLPEAKALPAILVVRLPNGLAHFVVAWSVDGRRVQVMDPAAGRQRLSRRALLDRVYVHRHAVPADAWRSWAGEEEFLSGLRARMAALGVAPGRCAALLDEALAEERWLPLAALDAAVRIVSSLVESGPRSLRRRSPELAERFFRRALVEGPEAIPRDFWFAAPPAGSGADAEQVVLRGAVLVRVAAVQPADDEGAPAQPQEERSRELRAALEGEDEPPMRRLLDIVRTDGWKAPVALLWAVVLAAGLVVAEALLFRGLLDLGRDLGTPLQRLAGGAAVTALAGLLTMVEVPVSTIAFQVGRRIETRLRMLFGRKIPRLEDRYFASRLISDMAERSHSVHRVRELPVLIQRIVRWSAQIAFTVAGIAWVGRGTLWLALLAGTAALAVPALFQRRLEEQDLRVRSHGGALSRYYFDGLFGLVPILSHGAERALRTEHEGVLREWVRAGTGFLRTSVGVLGLQLGVGLLLAVAMVGTHLRSGGTVGVLLLAYWSLRLPTLGEQVAMAARRLPGLRSITVRLMEPLGAPEAPEPARRPEGDAGAEAGVALRFQGVSVHAAGHRILDDVDLAIPAGAHLAVVGPSGAGKSTLMGVLLGWHRPHSGTVTVDGEPLGPAELHRLRETTAWIDPEVWLWNRSLLENLLYGTDGGSDSPPEEPFASTLRRADLLEVLERMPEGSNTSLGEGGGSVSGGEGQRVRFGRALQRRRARLAILDEPFRGLDRTSRRALLERARRQWSGATLLFVSHDLEETRSFPRVLVVEQGRVVEDGPPEELLARPGSRYRSLIDTEERAHRELWDGPRWRRLWMDGGRLAERGGRGE